MDVVVLDRQSEHEATEHERDDVVHVRFGDIIGGSKSEEREEEERRHGRDGHGHSLVDPPQEHPREHREHVAARSPATEIEEEEYDHARERPRDYEQVLQGEK